MIYQHPLAYLLGVEGMALMRAWAGDFDREFVEERMAEIRRLMAEESLRDHEGVEVLVGDSSMGYDQWAPSYDEPRNGLFDLDEPVVHPILDELPPGIALDAGCGTGRYAEYLAKRHRVIGVDSSPDMLDRARSRVPDGDFRLGNLDQLPLADVSVDLVMTALALSHVPDLAPVLAEFARVLRPGGHLIISDTHHELILRGSVVKLVGPNGEPAVVPTYRHTPGDFLRAALPLGFQLRHFFEEPALADNPGPPPDPPDELDPGPWQDWPWTLMNLIPAANQSAGHVPGVIVWHFVA